MRAGMASSAMEDEDEDRKRVATHIEWQKQGAWVVLWGAYTRRYWAFARWPLPPGGVAVCAVDPEALYGEMRRAEREHDFLRWRYGGRSAPAAGGPPPSARSSPP